MSSKSDPGRDGRRFPFAPVMALSPHRTEREVAESAGFSRRAVCRWHTAGLTSTVADRVAISIGRHPTEIWGDAWYGA